MRKNGELFEAFISLTPIFDEHGAHIGYSKVTQELTEQKKLEAHRQEIAGLEQARVVREREVAEERIEALQEASAHKDDFLGILSHELRTPINAIMGFGSILDDEISGPLNPEQHRYVGKILHGAEDLLSLINDLLDMSRIQAGKFYVDPAPVRLHEVVETVTEHLRPMLDRKVCRFEVDVPPHLPAVMADERRLGQVLANLIINAVKYSPGRCEIEVRARIHGEHVRCEVADNGAGISAGDRQRLFHPFEQLDMTKTRRAGGIGLGLSIVKALVEAHGGHVGVESDGPGRGSTFYFVLPLAG
jgi:signal transduction histidine kinase